MILDIHTHHDAPQPRGVISLDAAEMQDEYIPAYGQLYSIGVHPWHSDAATVEETFARLIQYAVMPWVVAIGEAGIDPNRGAPLFKQMLQLRRHVEVSERVGKPLLLHSVKAQDIIIGIYKEMQPRMPWIIHGFRGKVTVARMYLQAGIALSFGARYNSDSLAAAAQYDDSRLLLCETDDDPRDINTIIKTQAQTLQCANLQDIICRNTARILRLN